MPGIEPRAGAHWCVQGRSLFIMYKQNVNLGYIWHEAYVSSSEHVNWLTFCRVPLLLGQYTYCYILYLFIVFSFCFYSHVVLNFCFPFWYGAPYDSIWWVMKVIQIWKLKFFQNCALLRCCHQLVRKAISDFCISFGLSVVCKRCMSDVRKGVTALCPYNFLLVCMLFP